MKAIRLKTHILFLGLAAMCMLASCKKDKENGSNAGEGFEASTEQGVSGSKTYLDGTTVKWTDDDRIKVVNGEGTMLKFHLVEGRNTTHGKFYDLTDNHEGFFVSNYVAAYPTSAEINGTLVTFTLPNEQPYVDDGFGNHINPMVAYSTNRKLNFKNVLGGICFRFIGDCHITRIEVTSDDPADMLWGVGTVEANSDNNDYLVLNVANDAEDKNVISLTCDTVLSQSPINACFMIPPGTLESGFTVTLYDGDTELWQQQTITPPDTGFIQRSKIRKMQGDPIEVWMERN